MLSGPLRLMYRRCKPPSPARDPAAPPLRKLLTLFTVTPPPHTHRAKNDGESVDSSRPMSMSSLSWEHLSAVCLESPAQCIFWQT